MLGRISAVTQAFGIGLLTLAGALLLTYSAAARFAESPASIAARTVPFTIRWGRPPRTLRQGLREASLIRSDLLFQVLVERRGLEGAFPPGNVPAAVGHDAGSDCPHAEHRQRRGSDRDFPGRVAVEQIAERLADQTEIDDLEFMRLAREGSSTFAAEFDFLTGTPPGQSLEGYLFPDTYQIDGRRTRGI